MAMNDLPIPPPSGKYGAGRNYGERAYLSRLQACVLNILGRGSIDGSETVDTIFAMLRQTPTGRKALKEFRHRFGDGNNALNILKTRGYKLAPALAKQYYRTNVPPIRLAPKWVYEDRLISPRKARKG